LKCADCGTKTTEFLVQAGPKSLWKFKWTGFEAVNYCRNHLIEHFKESFLSSQNKMVVLYPEMEEKHGNYQYFFMTMSQLHDGYAGDPQINNQIVTLVEKWLGYIKNGCSRCSFPAQVAYFSKDKILRDKVPSYLGALFDYPMLHKMQSLPEILCKKCAFERIVPSLQSASPGFYEGICKPEPNQDGIYLTIEV
jgi:hypothetical protein